jgi:hypothetical protein
MAYMEIKTPNSFGISIGGVRLRTVVGRYADVKCADVRIVDMRIADVLMSSFTPLLSSPPAWVNSPHMYNSQISLYPLSNPLCRLRQRGSTSEA